MAAVMKDTALVLAKDADLRQQWFGAEVMCHPAKQSLYQLIHLLERFAVPGGILLDPFCGSGSAMIAAAPAHGGMYVIGVELASHFRAMQRRAWQHFQCSIEMQDVWGTPPGDFVSIAGDSRDLVNVLGDSDAIDLIVTSPSYGGSEAVDKRKKQNSTIGHHGGGNAVRAAYEQIARMPELPDRPRRGKHGFGPHSQLSAAQHSYNDDEVIDLIVTSPPYQDTLNNGHPARNARNVFREQRGNGPDRAAKYVQSYDVAPDDQINDLVVTSPPYQDAIAGKVGIYQDRIQSIYGPNSQVAIGTSYDATAENIGNQRGKKYLASMRAVWQGCAAVLKPGGILCCITRDCVQRGQRVMVGEQNRDLLIEAGLTFLECETWRVPQLSFWRQQQKRTAERKGQIPIIIETEEVWIFQKPPERIH